MVHATRETVAASLAEKISNRTARVGIIGLGYVGLPLAVEFAQALVTNPDSVRVT